MVHRSQRSRPGRPLSTGWGDGAQGTAVHSTLEWSGIPAGGPARPPDVPRAAGPDEAPADAPRHVRGVLAEIALLLVLVLALPPLLVGGAPAETTARRVLQALVDGDIATLQEHLAPAGDALDIALAPEVIAATAARIDRFAVLEVRTGQGHAEVDARLRVGGRSLTTTLHLVQEGQGPRPFRTWRLEPLTLPTVQVAIPVGAAQLRVNGQLLTVPDAARPRGAEGLGVITLRVLPGLYEIEAPSLGDLLDPIPVRVNVPPLLTPWTSVLLQAGYALTDSGERELAEQIRASLETCLTSTSARPLGCPIAAPGAGARQGDWRLVAPPEISAPGGWMGTYTAYARGGVAEFTVPAAAPGEEPRRYRIAVDARAVSTLDRGGELVTSWER